MRRYRTVLLTIAAACFALMVIAYANRGTLVAIGYDLLLADQVKESFANSYKPLDNRPKPSATGAAAEEKSPGIEKPFSMLLLGVDARPGEHVGRSDTIIYSVIRPKDGQVLMVSVQRDTYAEMVGRGTMDKITHAYAYGGAQMAVDSVEKLLETRVDHYATIDFQGFVKVVDQLGGIPLPITKDIVNKDPNHEKFTIKANQDLYNGVDALNYNRYREDAGGDTSRTERNRVFLEALMNKARQLNQWDEIPDIIRIVGESFETDMPPQNLSELARKFLQTGHTLRSYSLKGTGQRMGPQNLYYYVTDDEDLRQVRATIADWLDPETPASALTIPGKPAANAPAKQPL